MNWLCIVTVSVALALTGCNNGSTDDDELTEQEKDAKRTELRDAFVGTWQGTLSAESGERPTFTLVVEAVAADTATQCGTVELGSDVGIRCFTEYETKARGTLTTSDDTFQGVVVDGYLATIEARFELPNAGWLSLSNSGSGGSFSYGESQPQGQLEATRK